MSDAEQTPETHQGAAMPVLQEYTDQQSWFDYAFSGGATCCQTTCEACGRTYFVTSDGHGDYDEGELDGLRDLASADPTKCIEVPDFSSVPTAYHPATGKFIVVGCICDPAKKFCDWVESHAENLATYLEYYFRAKHQRAAYEAERAERKLCELAEKDFPGGKPIKTGPRNASLVEVKLRDGRVTNARWASDLSGEEQPAFQGWHENMGDYNRQVEPIAWRPIPAAPTPSEATR